MEKTAQEEAQVAKDQAEKYKDVPGAGQAPVPASVAPDYVDPGYDGTNCETEECAHKARALTLTPTPTLTPNPNPSLNPSPNPNPNPALTLTLTLT